MGAAIGAIGLVGSLAQTGIGMYQQHKAKIAGERALREAKALGPGVNAFESMRIGDEAYAAQEAKNAQTEANLVAGLSDQGVTAALGGIPMVQQQSMAANADIAAKKAADLQQVEMLKRQEQSRLNQAQRDYLKQLQLMEITGAGQAAAQGGQMAWQGIGRLSSTSSALLGSKSTMDELKGWGNTKLDAPDYSQALGGGM
jgi:hypothetical protein